MYIFSDEVRQAYEQLPIPFVIDQLIDGKVIPLLISDGFCKLVEMDRDKAAEWFVDGQFERIHPDDVGKVAHVSEEFINHRSGYNVVFRSRHKDSYHYIHAVGGWMTMPDGTELAALTYTDVSGSRDAISAATKEYGLFQQDLFFTDPVTGLPNVNYLHKYSNEKVHSMRVQGLKPALIYSDINFMQSYNNQYGFAKGDDLLRLVASVFMDVFPDALVTRGAEDHFIVITPMSDRKQLGASIDEANRRIKTEAYGNTTGIHAGICEYEDDMPTADALDLARRAFKRMGTNLNTAWRFFSREDDNLYWSRRYIIENFNKALENGWFKVYYQGIASVESRKEVALEALARWVDPIRGIISPKEFIPALEEYHLLHKMDLYIFEQVIREVQIRHENGLPLIPVSVNFSRQDFDHTDVISELNRIIDRYDIGQYGIGKDYFIIEITEQDMATATDHFYEQLTEIRRAGFRLWLDDFGSGYSSLNVFSKFDVDLIKFDMDLLKNLDRHNGANREIMKAMVTVSKKLGIHTLAEGMETEEQAGFLEEIGCELVQGYAFHRPESLEAILYRVKSGGMTKPLEPRENWYQLI